MFEDLKKKIASAVFGTSSNGKDAGPKSTKYPLDLRLGSPVEFDTNVPAVWSSLCKVPKNRSVTAISEFKLFGQTVFRFYFQEDAFLQIIMDKETGSSIEECRLYSIYHTVYPANKQEWMEWVGANGRIGVNSFELDGFQYFRVDSWADDPTADKAKTVNVVASMLRKNGTATCKHHIMLYGRWLDEESEVAEFLLVSDDEYADNACITFAIGIDVSEYEIKS
jgi:hypothetical protein